MPLTTPNLDDRDFKQLLDESLQRIRHRCPEWSDRTPSDPGIVLLELFAHLTEVMIYRLNRVPDKAYVEFLRLMGVKLLPPAAASVQVQFKLSRPAERAVEIPRGTRVTVGRAGGAKEPPVFTTARDARIAAGQTEALVTAHHCELVEAELAGRGTGLPGLALSAQRPPMVAGLGDELDLVVGVEASAQEREARAQNVKFIEHQGKAFRVWREVDDFTDLGPDGFAYVADRMTGMITFAPALYRRDAQGRREEQARALAEIPAAGREIRLWYRRGGGPAGNLAAHTLTVLKDPPRDLGLSVTNLEPAKGGAAAETLENALVRGPQELHTLERAVTAGDFKRIALKTSNAVKRARAFTQAALWRHAPPGTVEVLLVPDVPAELRAQARLTPQQLREQQTDTVRELIRAELENRSPLGTFCLVDWVRYKEVRVKARIVIHREENPQAVRERVLRRLQDTISPLPSPERGTPGWHFGRPLRASDVFDIVLAEPGVSYADQVRLVVDAVPEKDVAALAADPFQRRTWHAVSGERFYRSTNDGQGWEHAGTFAGENTQLVRPNPGRPGWIALITQAPGDDTASRVHLSMDCGGSWTMVAQTAFAIHDVAWLMRKDSPVLLLASDKGLFELSAQPQAVPLPVLVDPQKQDRGFYAVAVSATARGEAGVAVASMGGEGIFFSDREGLPNTFRPIGLKGEDVRVLEVEERGPRRFLWAGVTVAGFEPGKGCFRLELYSGQEEWTAFTRGWDGGSCVGLAFLESKVVAATHHAGVLWLDSTQETQNPPWQKPEVNCGLPMRDVSRFQRVAAVATDPAGRQFMAAGTEGIFHGADPAARYDACSQREFSEQVTLPDTWLFCSGDHEINIVSEDEAHRD